jgi:chromosome segregation ATPase
MPKLLNNTKPGEISSEDEAVQKKLEKLKEEYAALHTKKITAEADIKSLEKSLEKLKATAEKDYGTSDIEELQGELERRRQENKDKVDHYEQHIREIQGNLTDIEKSQGEDA